ncbi:hypothetical protein [[Clostridium] scindens]|uniref:hypothetical protein n=1 Tax=Clostridium scindens (strain JCM 10418 / VPI 12708) TaxID=29347 RepID=UPI001D06609D|nr:hypothetical protein [[Clostridium] scindens]MCB6423085.1 hypothetical protein [[Clostridium] scindens]
MIRSIDPTLNPDQIKEVICTTAIDIYGQGKDDQSGYGIVNAQKALEKVTGKGVPSYEKTGWLKYNGKWFYYMGNQTLAIGWKKIDGIWYYCDSKDGTMYEKQWMNDTYYLKPGGYMARGWYKINETYFYFLNSGVKAVNRWVGNYYLKSDGAIVVSEWVDKERYYVDENGKWVQGKKK